MYIHLTILCLLETSFNAPSLNLQDMTIGSSLVCSMKVWFKKKQPKTLNGWVVLAAEHKSKATATHLIQKSFINEHKMWTFVTAKVKLYLKVDIISCHIAS